MPSPSLPSPGVSLSGIGDLARLFVYTNDPVARRATQLAFPLATSELGRVRGPSPLILVPEELGDVLTDSDSDSGYRSLGPRVEVLLTPAAVARVAGHMRPRA
jgi:hypothetical protein